MSKPTPDVYEQGKGMDAHNQVMREIRSRKEASYDPHEPTRVWLDEDNTPTGVKTSLTIILNTAVITRMARMPSSCSTNSSECVFTDARRWSGMGYACPVCAAEQADAKHLANHLAVTASLGRDNHREWLEEHAPSWGECTPEELGEIVSQHADEIETPRPYPLQAIGFGTDLTFVSLSGEVVADYSLVLKDELASPLWVAGYANNTGYLPTKRILAEGGYEAWQSFEDGRYASSTPERILTTATALAERVGARRRNVEGRR